MALLLTSCETSRYHIANDHAPVRKPRHDELSDAVPTGEKPSAQGNRPYTVHGKRYYPIKPIEGYSEFGEASWYGSKFHGHLTANGEVYDMFKMTAAHKTLPLPSYIKVTNLNTSQSVVVRVNDRGPFHHKRVLDLSYAAAYKIGLTATGVASVKIELIRPSTVLASAPHSTDTTLNDNLPTAIATLKSPQPIQPPMREPKAEQITETSPATTENPVHLSSVQSTCAPLNESLTNIYVIQLLSTSSLTKLQTIAKQLPIQHIPNDITTAGTATCFYQPFTQNSATAFRLLIGTFSTYKDAQNAQQQLSNRGADSGFIRKL